MLLAVTIYHNALWICVSMGHTFLPLMGVRIIFKKCNIEKTKTKQNKTKKVFLLGIATSLDWIEQYTIFLGAKLLVLATHPQSHPPPNYTLCWLIFEGIPQCNAHELMLYLFAKKPRMIIL